MLKLWFSFAFLLFLYGCENYPSNVEVKYKNPDGNLYKSSSEVHEPVEQKAKLKPTSATAEEGSALEKPAAYHNPNVLHKSEDLPQVKKTEEGYHVVQNGETYYSIARLYRLSPQDLMAWNDFNGGVLRPGTIIGLSRASENSAPPEHPGKNSVAMASVKPLSVKVATSPGSSAELPPASVKNLGDSVSKKEPVSKTFVSSELVASSTKKCGNNRFKPPVKSEGFVAKYGEMGSSGVKNDGDLIKTNPKAKVLAADSGQVVYTGNGFSEYENIVIMKHNDNYFTIYGHLHNILVQKGDMVKGGSVISSISEKKSYLYFAIRKGKMAINPQLCI